MNIVRMMMRFAGGMAIVSRHWHAGIRARRNVVAAF